MDHRSDEIFQSLHKDMKIVRPQSIAIITEKGENKFKYKTGETINTIKKKDFEDFYRKLMEGTINKDWYLKRRGVHNCDFYVIGGIFEGYNIAKRAKSMYIKI